MIPTPPPAYLRHDYSKRTTSTSLLSDLPILCSSSPETEQELALPMDSKDILDLEVDSATPSSLVGVSLKEKSLLHSNLVQGCSSPISESQGQWALSDHEKEVYDRLFASWDKSNTGLFQGLFANELFGATGLTTEELAKIWYDRYNGPIHSYFAHTLRINSIGLLRTWGIVARSISSNFVLH